MKIKKIIISCFCIFLFNTNLAYATGTLNDTGTLVQTYTNNGLDISSTSAESIGEFVFFASGGNKNGVRLARFNRDGTSPVYFSPGIDFRSIFADDVNGVLYAKDGTDNFIYTILITHELPPSCIK